MRFFVKLIQYIPVLSALMGWLIMGRFLSAGIDLSDEGYGLMGISGAPDYNPFLGGSYLSALLFPKPPRFLDFRILRVVLQLSTSLFSGFCLVRYFSYKGSKVPFWLISSVLFTGFMFAGGNFGLGLGYNSLSSCIGILSIGVMAYLLSNPASVKLPLLMACFGGWLHAMHFFTRIPSAFLFSICWMIFFLILIIQDRKKILFPFLMWLAGVSFGLLFYHIFIHPLPHHMLELNQWLQHIEGHSMDELLKLYDRSWQRLKTNAIIPFQHLWVAAWIAGICFIFYSKNLGVKIAAFGFALITCIGMIDYMYFASSESLFTGGIIFHYRSAEPLILCTLCVLGLTVPSLMTQNTILSSSKNLGFWFISLMLLFNPFVMSVGTGNELFIQILIQLPGLIVACFLLIYLTKNVWSQLMSGIIFALLLWVGTQQTLSGYIFHPYRIQSNLLNQNITLRKIKTLKGMYVDTKTVNFIEAIIPVLQQNSNKVVVDLCKVPGVLYLCEKHTPCNAWFSLQTPKANAWFIEHSQADISRCSFILPADYVPDSLLLHALRGRGNLFPEGYEKKIVMPHYLHGYEPLPFNEMVEVYTPLENPKR